MKHLVLTPNKISDGIDRMFGDLFNSTPFLANVNSDFAPRVDISENDSRIKLEFELPGMDKESIKVTVRDGFLSVSGERKEESKVESDTYVRSEIFSGRFSRSFTLPETVETDKISADYKNGMLTLELPKSEKAKPKMIDVKVS